MIYEPREDSFLLQKAVKKSVKNKSFLDLGAGSGIQSKTALENGAKSVLAADIQKDAVKYLKSKKIPVIQSDLFSNIKGKFDLIAFNPPYLPIDKQEDKESQIVTTGGKKGDELTLRFLKQAPKHLEKDGKILLVVSSLTPKKRINSLLKKLKVKKHTLATKKLFMESLEVWEITL